MALDSRGLESIARGVELEWTGAMVHGAGARGQGGVRRRCLAVGHAHVWGAGQGLAALRVRRGVG